MSYVVIHNRQHNPMRIWFWYSNFRLSDWCSVVVCCAVISIVIIFVIEISSFFALSSRGFLTRLKWRRGMSMENSILIMCMGFRVFFDVTRTTDSSGGGSERKKNRENFYHTINDFCGYFRFSCLSLGRFKRNNIRDKGLQRKVSSLGRFLRYRSESILLCCSKSTPSADYTNRKSQM